MNEFMQWAGIILLMFLFWGEPNIFDAAQERTRAYLTEQPETKEADTANKDVSDTGV